MAKKDWHNDFGLTKRDSFFIGMDELDERALANTVPCRTGFVGMTTIVGSGRAQINEVAKTVRYYPGAAATLFRFREMKIGGSSTNDSSLHYKWFSPKQIAEAGKASVGHLRFYADMPANGVINFMTFNEVGGAGGGWYFEVVKSLTRHRLVANHMKPGVTQGSREIKLDEFDGTSTHAWSPGSWQRLEWVIDFPNAGRTRMRFWISDDAGVYANNGAPILDANFDGRADIYTANNLIHYLGGNNTGTMELSSFFGTLVDPTEADSVRAQIHQWFNNPAKHYDYPDFDRKPPRPLAAPAFDPIEYPSSGDFFAYWAFDGISFSFQSFRDFWLRWGLPCSIARGVGMLIGANAFQPNEGVYNTTSFRDTVQWLGTRDCMVAITINDQTYNNLAEMPDHIPHFVVGGRRVWTWWDNIEAFDPRLILSNINDYLDYRQEWHDNGTMRMAHHVIHLVKAVGDLPNLVGISFGETSGHPRVTTDPIVNGVSNPEGVYGITDSAGNYLPNKRMSLDKQLMFYDKFGDFINGLLAIFRPASLPKVTKSVQFNYFKSDIPGTLGGFTLTTTDGFINREGQLQNGYGLHVETDVPGVTGSWGIENTGLQAGVQYYVVQSQAGKFKLSLTPGGSPIALSLPAGAYNLRFAQQAYYQEMILDRQRVQTLHNGLMLQDQSRAAYKLFHILKKHGWIVSGPDVVTQGIEAKLYGVGGTPLGNPGTYSCVDLCRWMSEGTNWFDDAADGQGLGPMELQDQDSGSDCQLRYTEANLKALMPIFGNTITPEDGVERFSIRQVKMFAYERWKVMRLTSFAHNNGPGQNKFFPWGYRALQLRNLRM